MAIITLIKTPTKHPRSPSPVIEHHKKPKTTTSVTMPSEIIVHIASYADDATRAVLLRTSRANYDLVGPILYERITISRENAAKLFMGLPRSDPRPAKKRADSPKDSTSTQPLQLHWPYVSIESNDEYEMEGSPDATYNVSQNTFDRKLKLLKMVKHIIVASLPGHQACRDLDAWKRYVGRNISRSIFPNATTICHQARAIWQFLDWSDRHVEFDWDHPHPLVQMLRDGSSKANVCLTCPDFKHINRQAYLKHRTQCSTASTADELSERFMALLKDIPSKITWHIVAFYAKTLTIHGFPSGSVPDRPGKVRVFFTDCECRGISITDKQCDTHASTETRAKSIRDLASSVAQRRASNRQYGLQDQVSEVWELMSPPNYSSSASESDDS
ncbi:uncharacterized protein I303_104319 [Kwoniella dejecticola CBS 10117]|uniref:Uncharacterized protein n=1 Tax=Kwoniella dejecticola CBS 10117 TaxID=1296121 RepID=A0A1A6A5P0_9TREE|nr:uncharacterized protein I303_04707 [Kwoniella dejecticola CBS 10117]OBR85372.1 hypothetical protein I303_04707 [Kwoniella dejecticola CBS 10117]